MAVSLPNRPDVVVHYDEGIASGTDQTAAGSSGRKRHRALGSRFWFSGRRQARRRGYAGTAKLVRPILILVAEASRLLADPRLACLWLRLSLSYGGSDAAQRIREWVFETFGLARAD